MDMTTAITMRELQKMSARKIAALRHMVPIKSDGRTVAFLSPIPKADPKDLAELLRLGEELDASRTPEQRAAIAEVLREIGEE